MSSATRTSPVPAQSTATNASSESSTGPHPVVTGSSHKRLPRWERQLRDQDDLAGQLRAVLAEHHESMAQKLHDVLSHAGSDRQSLFDDYRRFMAAHRAAMSVWFYAPTAPGHTLDAIRVRIIEEDQTDNLVRQLEQFNIMSEEFTFGCSRLSTQMLTHSRIEADDIVPMMIAEAEPSTMMVMLRALVTVPRMARGNGHSATMSPRCTFDGLLLIATHSFAGMPQD